MRRDTNSPEWFATKSIKALQRQAVVALGGSCVKCSFLDSRALQIDHINGGGTQERKQQLSAY